MSNLIPQKRMDKNGIMVTKHVKADQSSAPSSFSVPAPVLPYGTESSLDSGTKELVNKIGKNFSKANTPLTYSHLELIEGTKAQPPLQSLLEALAEATEGIDEQGAKSLLDGFDIYRANRHNQNAAILELSARAYVFCRKVDDATPHSDNVNDEFFWYGRIGGFAKDFFRSDPTDGSDPGDVTDLEGAYLLDRLDLNDKERFNTEGAYYRAMGKLKEKREDIIDYMPLLITARMVAHRDYMYLDDIFQLSDYLKKICPVDKVEVIAAEVLKRRVFDVDAIEQIAKAEANSMIDGVL